MDISKTDPEKNDSKSKTKIPPIPKTASRYSGSVSMMDTAQSKIPKRDILSTKVCSSKDTRNKSTKPNKKVGIHKSSASLMNLNLPKTASLAPSRSCFNSHRSVKSKEQSPRLENIDKMSENKKKAERAASKRKLQLFELAKEKLQNCQDQFMTKYNLIKDELPQEERDLKLVCVFKNNEGQLVTKNEAPRIITMCDKKTLEQMKISLKNFAQKKLEAIDAFDQLPRSPREIGDTFVHPEHFKQIEEAKRKLQIEKKTFLDDFLNEIESLQANDKFKESTSNNKELETKVKSLLDKVNELSKNLEESQAELTKIKKNCEQKCCTFKKELDEKNKAQSKKQLEFDELKKKYDCLEKDSSKTKSINKETAEKLIKKTHEWEDLNQKLKCCASNNVKLEAKNKDLELTIEKLKAELNTALNCDKIFIRDHADEMDALKNELMNAKKEREIFEMEVQSLKKETIKIEELESKFLELQDEISQANAEKQILNQTIKDLTIKLEASQRRESVSRDVQEELTRLRRVENLSNEKVKNLENELTKAQFQIKKLEEKILMDGKLLTIRTDLIDSLQKKEKSQKIRLTDLFAEVTEKNNDLQVIKSENIKKTEEFKNLFSTLGSKQMELTRQEHMIKLLQENNERAQKLRVKQEAKIARLEEEILELKQEISIYQDVVLPNNTLRRNLAMAEACRGDYTDSLGFYVEERRKKRHIDISVKKYEK